MNFEIRNLKKLNKFGLDCTAKNYFKFTEVAELENLAKNIYLIPEEILILGGGSNIVLPQKFEGVVLHPCNEKIEILENTPSSVIVRAYAGLEWDLFVAYCVDNGWGGLENLSLIPGNVGAAPVQNIGAYGTEVCEFIEKVTCYNLSTNKIEILETQDCQFSYRYSVFKKRTELLVLSVDFKLYKPSKAALKNLQGGKKSISYFSKEIWHLINLIAHSFKLGPKTKWHPRISFDNVRRLLDLDILPISLKRKLVCTIRKKTMPDPAKTGNAGCFFKSPIVQNSAVQRLKFLFPNVSLYPNTPDTFKVSAGDLIRECGWAGKKIGDVSINERRPLVVLNHGNATAEEIVAFANNIITDIQIKFDITLEPEVVIVQ